MEKSDQEMLKNYLYNLCEDGKQAYVSSRRVANELGLPSRQVGVYMGQYRRKSPTIYGCVMSIAAYARSSAKTTWKITVVPVGDA